MVYVDKRDVLAVLEWKCSVLAFLKLNLIFLFRTSDSEAVICVCVCCGALLLSERMLPPIIARPSTSSPSSSW